MKEIHLSGKKIIYEKSKLLLHYEADGNFEKYFKVMAGEWHYENGYLIGTEYGNRGGNLFTRERYCDGRNVMISFIGGTVLPATRDVNAVFCAKWNNETGHIGESYICGLNGWWENKAGIESNSPGGFFSLTNSYRYTPGTDIRMTAGSIDGHTFMVVDDVLVTEYRDPTPITGGHLGFSPYCTKMKVKEIEIREIYWEPFHQSYEPEFE